MPAVGGLDIHRKLITFDYLDTVTGAVERGQTPRPTGSTWPRGWCPRFQPGGQDVQFAVEGCTG